MATRTRTKPSRRRGPLSDAGRSGLGRFAANAKRGWKRTLRRHPSVGVVAQIVLGLVAVVSLLLGVVLESALYYLVVALAGLGTLAIRRAQSMERARQGVPPKPSSGGPRTPPSPSSSGGTAKPRASSVGPLKCTATGKPADPKVPGACDCHSRHVQSQRGVDKFGLPLGHPYGRRKPAPKTGGGGLL